MNCHDIEARLADYLGNELDAVQTAEIERHLAHCSGCRAGVDALCGTIRSLRALPDVSLEDAGRRTAELVVVRRRSPLIRTIGSGLRAAAMIGIGVLLGWAAFGRSEAGDDVVPKSSPVRLATSDGGITDGVHPAWHERGRKVASAPSSFARHLAMLAPSGD